MIQRQKEAARHAPFPIAAAAAAAAAAVAAAAAAAAEVRLESTKCIVSGRKIGERGLYEVVNGSSYKSSSSSSSSSTGRINKRSFS